MSDSKVDDGWQEYWASNGTFSFTPDDTAAERRRQEVNVYKGQNRLLETVAKALDREFPPEDYGNGHGTGHTSPGDIVRQFIVTIEEAESGHDR